MAQFHVIAGGDHSVLYPEVRRIGMTDVFEALRMGFEDFWAKPSHYVFLCLIYPLAGLFITYWSANANALPLLFPLMSGFALVGPIAALPLYEMSRRREENLDTSWRRAFEVGQSPALPSILAVGIFLFAVFITWLVVAQSLYTHYFGPMPPETLSTLMSQIFSTEEGRSLMFAGCGIGLLFAIVVLCSTIVAFPMLLDQDCGAAAAVMTSLRVVVRNPVEALLWAAVVTVMLVIGFATMFAGLALVIPILGHATWHLYRKTVVRPAAMRI
ncbi:DUF2189 domain-containing protein [Ochrobactrum sp. CM-21-5]|nr:DUF2189 domain-containing protein [Ochrobactrum sp. CM-21-5]MBC2884361.1 DUF2189 domain-containing protein [Ochrobactrum sp. CM-21-5]